MTYTFAVSRRSLPVRCLCVLLCLLVLWCFFMVPRAGAVVAEAELAYWGGAIVVSVLAAGGLALASGDAAKIGPAMYTALKDTGGKAWDSIQAMAAWAASAGTKVKDAAFRVGSDVWQAIKDVFSKSYSDGSFLISGNSFTFNADAEPGSDDYKASRALFDSFNGKRYTTVSVSSASGTYTCFTSLLERRTDDCSWGFWLSSPSGTEFINNWYGVTCSPQIGSYYNSYCFICYTYKSDGSTYSYSDDHWISAKGDTVVTGYYSFDVELSGDLVYPGDDYLVKAPDLPTVDTNTGAVSWPSDAVWTKDAVAAPYPVGDDGVKVPDIPFDVPVDGTTGKALDDAGTDTDNPSKPGKGEGTETGTTAGLIGSIIELLKNFFDSPSDFRLNLDGFRNLILPDRFPFSIPFDMVKAVKLFAAAAADFVFRIDLDTQYFSVHHTVDLTPYAVPIAFFRYACVFWFAWILISRTHDLIKW